MYLFSPHLNPTRMIPRGVTQQVLPWLGTNKVIILKGARRVGKSVVMQEIESHLKEKGEHTMFISAEQKRHLPIFSDPKLFMRFLKEQYNFGNLADGKKLYVFIDEFQYIKEAGTFLREIYEAGGDLIQLVLAASTSFKVARSTEELMDIRKIFYVRRLPFEKFMKVKAGPVYGKTFNLNEKEELQEFYNTYREEIEHYITEYMYWGGYPEIVQETNPEKRFEILDDIIHRYIEKDISLFMRVENVDAYIQLMSVLSSEVGNLLNHQDLSTRLNIHKKTLGKYLEIISGTFAFAFVPPYFTDTKKELAKMNKVYASDPGIVSYFLHQMPPERFGYFPNLSRVKNFVFTELRKHGFEGDMFFYRTIAKAEIDFIVCKGKETIPIKIKFGKKKQKVPVVVKNFMNTYSETTKRAVIITQDELRFEGNTAFIPVTLFPFIEL